MGTQNDTRVAGSNEGDVANKVSRSMTPLRNRPGDVEDVSRRDLAAKLLVGAGILGLAGCVDDEGRNIDSTTEALSGGAASWADTMTDLRALIGSDTTATSKPVVVLGGYYAVGDGGGGVFYWDTTSSTGDNGGTIIVPTGSSTGRWIRLYAGGDATGYKPTGPLNVRHFGAKGDGLNADDVPINATISAAIAQGGGDVYIPPGTYRTTSYIIIAGSHIRLLGAGESTVIEPTSGAPYNTLSIGDGVNDYNGITVRDIVFKESNKEVSSGSNALSIFRIFRVAIIDCYIDAAVSGVHVYACNTVEFERVRVHNIRGNTSNHGFLIEGDANGRTDVVTFKNVVIQGVSAGTLSRHGVIIDGNVNTVSAYKLYSNGIDGSGLWFRNTKGSSNPEFATIYGYESEFCYLEGIRIDAGREMFFSDVEVHGSRQRANVALNGSATVITFKGGFIHGAARQGLHIMGQQISISGMHIYSNSNSWMGHYAGIEIDGSSMRVSIVGNINTDENDSKQGPGVLVDLGADHFIVLGNIGSIINNAGFGSSKVVASNAA